MNFNIDQFFLVNKLSPSNIINLINILNNDNNIAKLLANKSYNYILNNYDKVDESYLLVLAISLRYNGYPEKIIKKYIDNPIINSAHLLIYFSGKYIDDIKEIYNTEQSLESIIDKKYMTKLHIMLDIIPDNLDYKDISISEIIRDHSINYINLIMDHKININNHNFYNLCIKYLNYNAAYMAVKNNIKITYYNINLLVVLYNNINNVNDRGDNTIFRKCIKEMIQMIVNHDYNLDVYQEEYINNELYTINGITSVNVNNDMKIYSHLLGINHTKGIKYIKNKLRQISIDNIKKASIIIGMYRLSRDEKLKEYDINTMTLNTESDEIDLYYYKDDKGIDWIFTTEIFEEIYNNGLNIYTGEKIRENDKNAIYKKRGLLKRLNYVVNYDKNTNKILIDQLQHIRNKFFAIAKIYGISSYQIESLNLDVLEKLVLYISEKFNLPYIHINCLNRDHAHYTFYKYICENSLKKINILAIIFKEILKIHNKL